MDSRSHLTRFGIFYAALYAAVAVHYPLFPVYLKLREFSPSRIGLLVGAVEIAGMTGPLLVSPWADRRGTFRAIMAVLLLAAAGSLALLARFSLFPLVLAASFSYGLTLKTVLPLSDALAGRALADASGNYGKVRLWGTVSFIVVSLMLPLTGLTDTAPGLMRLFLIALAVLIPILAVAPAASGGRTTARVSAEASDRLPSGFYAFLALGFLGNIGLGIYQSFGPLFFAQLFGPSRVSLLFALSGLVEIPVMALGGRMFLRLGHRKMLMAAWTAMTLRLLVMAFLPIRIPVLLGQTTHALCYGFFFLAGIDWVNRTVPAGLRALGMGLFMAVCFSAAQFLGGVAGGFLLEFGGFSLLFGLASIAPAAAAVLLLLNPKVKP